MSTTRFFLDWINVYKGQMEITLDPERISVEGRAEIERLKGVRGGKHPELSGHGMKRALLPYGVKITIEPARKSAPWLTADRPWEERIGSVTVLEDAGKYRCWYQVGFPRPLATEKKVESVFHKGREVQMGKSGTAYAESEDGVHWVKPALGLFAFDGSTATNIVSTEQDGGTVFRDDGAPAAERYKLIIWDRVSDDPDRVDYGLFGAVSPDGLRWTRLPEPLVRYFCDTQNIVYWDEQKRKYVGYFRHHLGGRAIGYGETDDFRTWPTLATIAHAGPLDNPSDDYYTNGFTRHPDDASIKLIFSSIFHHDSDLVDVRLGLTHNGRVINWVSYDPIIAVGQPGAWDCASIYAGPTMVRLPNGTLAVPYVGCLTTHNGQYGSFYGKEDRDGEAALAWAVWDDGRLAGIEAEHHGEFWCIPEDAFDGGPIEINARVTGAGSVEVELWEYFAAKPIPGYTFAECIPFRGNELWTPLRWKGKGNLAELRGSRIILRFRLSSAKIYGYRL